MKKASGKAQKGKALQNSQNFWREQGKEKTEGRGGKVTSKGKKSKGHHTAPCE